jgi:MoaA/NifB/PqqE/SkfB family radical SAM enzyme
VQKPFVPGSLFLAVWDITYACNLNYTHCYANAGKKLADEMSMEQAKRVVDTLARASVPMVAFSGGEQLVRSDIFELASYANDRGIYVAVATNGILVTKEKAREMKNAGIQFVQISLDSATAGTHDHFRGIAGVFDRTIQGIRNAVDARFLVNLATTATKDNYREIPAIIEMCQHIGVDWFMAYNFVQTGRG